MKRWPTLTSDEEAEVFVAESDLTQYDLSELVPVRFIVGPAVTGLTVSLPETLVEAVRKEAARVGVPDQEFIRRALERALPDR